MGYTDREKQKTYLNQHYLDNKEKYLEAGRRKRERVKDFVNTLKTASGCIYCGEKDFRCLDFHHRDPKTKKLTVSRAMRSQGRETLVSELEKCDVMCANCHRKFHKTTPD